MSNNPKITVEADLSKFEAELNGLKSTVAQFGDKLKTESGKAHFNFKGSKAELDALVKAADKLTAALDKGDKKSAQYVKNLKAAQDALNKAAGVASKLEEAGSSKNKNISGYFRNYAAELDTDRAELASGSASEKAFARFQAEQQAKNEKWANRASKLIGFAGGSIMGGGGGYSTFGAGMGSLLPGAAGIVGGAVGGIIGGTADRHMGQAKDEARMYSELRRSLGSTTTDFDLLRDSVRHVISGFGVTDNEAANLANQFAKIAGLSGDETGYIASSMRTSLGFAQGYGMAPGAATDFFANMKLVGGARNDTDNRRLALMIGESVQRGGTSAKMDEVLSALSGMASHYAQNAMSAPGVGQYASYLSTLTGSNYSGVSGDPNSAANLMNMMNSGASGGGTKGDASRYHWLMAAQRALPGMSMLDFGTMQTAGAFGELSPLFAEDSAQMKVAMENKDQSTVDQLRRTRQSIDGSGYRNMFGIGMNYINSVAGGNSYMQNSMFRGMFGGNQQQAAVLIDRLQKDPGLGRLESELHRYHIGLDKLQPSQVAVMSQLLKGGDDSTEAMVKQYDKLIESGKLHGDEKSAADSIMKREGYGENFKKMLLDLTAKYDVDDGQKAQTTQIDIQNKIQEKVSDLIGVETIAKDGILEIVKFFSGDNNPLIKRIERDKYGVDISGNNMTGVPMIKSYHSDRMHEIDDVVSKISGAGSDEERSNIAEWLMSKVRENPQYYPLETPEIIDRALSAVGQKKPKTSGTLDSPTIPSVIPAFKGKNLADLKGMLMQKNPEMSEMDAAALVGSAAFETGGFKVLHDPNSGGGLGVMGMAHWRGDRQRAFREYLARTGLSHDDPEANVGFMTEELHGTHSRFYERLRAAKTLEDKEWLTHQVYEAPGETSSYGRRLGLAYKAMDQMPSNQRRRTGKSSDTMTFKHGIDVRLFGSDGKLIADPFSVSTSFGGGNLYAGA